MKTLFKSSLLLLITTIATYAQNQPIIDRMDEKRVVFDQSFSATKQTTFVMDVEFTTLTIRESTNGKVNINYEMGFNNYRGKQIEELIKHYKLEANKTDNKIRFVSKGRSPQDYYKYDWESYFNKTLARLGNENGSENAIVQKSKDSVLKEINESDIQKFIRLKGFKKKTENEKKKTKVRGKFYASKMVVEVPPYVNFRVTVKNSEIIFEDDLRNPTNVNSKNSKLKFKSITNVDNNFNVDGGKLKAVKIANGTYKFLNLIKGLIGELTNSKVESEFSKIEIGEMGKNAKIEDFNSEYWFYNWAKDFKQFDFISEYSKIHFFYPDLNHTLEVRGYNTRNLLGAEEFEVTMQPKSKEKNLLMSKPAKPNERLSGQIYLEMLNGIIYSHNDAIKSINKE